MHLPALSFDGIQRSLHLAFAVALLTLLTPPARASEAALWDAVKRPDHIVLIRHALAPGTGDPPQFRVDDCATQRNLSAEGRAQAARIGERFRSNGIASAIVQSSRWCRCLETARLLGLGEIRPNALLDSFFADRSAGSPRTASLRAWLSQQPATAPLVLVTHQVNITELTGVYPAAGEIVVAKRRPDGSVEVVGTIKPL
jgi:phosphohistidine phosphatase SixA